MEEIDLGETVRISVTVRSVGDNFNNSSVILGDSNTKHLKFSTGERVEKGTFVYTLVRLIMTGNIVVGKNNGGYKYGGIGEKPPNLTRHYFTCNIIFTKKFLNPPNFTCHIAKFYPIFFTDCVFVCSFKVKDHLKSKELFQEKQRIINRL